MKLRLVLPTVFVLAAAGCGGSASSPATAPSQPHQSASAGAPSPAAATDTLTGSWQTAALPTATYVATYRKAGAPPSAVRQFRAGLSGAGHDHRYLIRIADGQWVELEQHADGTPQVGWTGTYTLIGNTVHATENQTGCRLTYRVTMNAGSLRIRLLSDKPESSPQCGRTDSWPQRSIYETSAFHRVS
jgi:hypothetical protein